ncbi:MAG: hypothetical protein J6R35_02465, partial [Clostridia bacterium]|nr:hypothetical protein [Clostridia bacterium]
TYLIGKWLKDKKIWVRCLVGAIPPIVVNALVLPLMWWISGSDAAFFINMGLLLATQTGSVAVLGTPLVMGLDRAKIGKK